MRTNDLAFKLASSSNGVPGGGWHESTWDLQCGLDVLEDDIAPELLPTEWQAASIHAFNARYAAV